MIDKAWDIYDELVDSFRLLNSEIGNDQNQKTKTKTKHLISFSSP